VLQIINVIDKGNIVCLKVFTTLIPISYLQFKTATEIVNDSQNSSKSANWSVQ